MPPRGSSLVTDQRTVGSAARFVRNDAVVAVPLLLLGPALLVVAIPKHSQVFPDVLHAGIVVLYREIRKLVLGNAVDDQLLFVLVVDVLRMQQVGDDDLGTWNGQARHGSCCG